MDCFELITNVDTSKKDNFDANSEIRFALFLQYKRIGAVQCSKFYFFIKKWLCFSLIVVRFCFKAARRSYFLKLWIKDFLFVMWRIFYYIFKN